MRKRIFVLSSVFLAVLLPFSTNVAQSAGNSSSNNATNSNPGNGSGQSRAWTKSEMSQAVSRDLFVDERGLAFTKSRAGDFVPYGHSIQFAAGPSKNPDTTKGRFKTPAPAPSPTQTQLPTISNLEWTAGNFVQQAAGRLYFFMPTTGSKLNDVSTWGAYVCTGTVVTDTRSDQSLILTAAHCIFDDVNKVFAQRVMFIPNQSASGTPSDRYCGNDIMGCWLPYFGVVDADWTTRTFPANASWDYGYYVVINTGAHLGNGGDANLVLDSAVKSPLDINFSSTIPSSYSYAFGYSFNQDPRFMYCAQVLGVTSALIATGQWWLSQCGLSNGASGGPWMQSLGSGPIISVNSWGYSGSLGMAGPRLSVSARCLYQAAEDPNSKPAKGGVIPADC